MMPVSFDSLSVPTLPPDDNDLPDAKRSAWLQWSIKTRFLVIVLLGALSLGSAFVASLGMLRHQMTEAQIARAAALADASRDIAAHFYFRSVRGDFDEETAKEQAREVIRDQQRPNGEYVFIFEKHGWLVMHPMHPEGEGTNLISRQDEDGVYYIVQMIAQAQRGGGVVSYRFPDEADGRSGAKVSYVVPFDPWGWVIGTGIYVEDITADFWHFGTELAIVGALGLLLLLGIALLAARSVARPILALVTVTQRIRDRDFGTEIPGAGRDDEIGLLARALGSLRDQAKERDELRHQRELAAKVFDASRDAIVIADRSGTIVSANPAFTTITGFETDEAVGRMPAIPSDETASSTSHETIWEALVEHGFWEGEVWRRRRDGETYLAHETYIAIDAKSGEIANFIGIQCDITDQRRQEAEIHRLAYHDPLTGLPNRSLLIDRLEHAMTLARRDERQLALVFLDLDNFKMLNDTLGHVVGDKLLKRAAERISGAVRESDTVARMGGDEFVVLMEDVQDETGIAQVTERIIQTLSEPLDVADRKIHLGTSAGIAVYPDDGAEIVGLMKNADTAMYAAKAAGRNTYRFFAPTMTDRTEQRLRLEMDLRRALQEGEFELFYQPKICLITGYPCQAEALIRWRHPEKGLVAPGDFIPVAEETGLITIIGDWVIDTACRQIAVWEKQGLAGIRVSVNVSARQFVAKDFAHRLGKVMKAHGVVPESLEVELTESILMKNIDKAIDVLSQLRKLGISVAVDDFGTGYSSLSYLKRLPIDVLKIDRAFVVDAARNEEDEKIVRTITGLGQALGLRTVAEGVETSGQVALLRRARCMMAQGFYFARPMPVAEYEDWMKAKGRFRCDGERCKEICNVRVTN